MNIDRYTSVSVGQIETFLKRTEVIKFFACDKLARFWIQNINILLNKMAGESHTPGERILDSKQYVPFEAAELFWNLVQRMDGDVQPVVDLPVRTAKLIVVASNQFWEPPSGGIEKPRVRLSLVSKK